MLRADHSVSWNNVSCHMSALALATDHHIVCGSCLTLCRPLRRMLLRRMSLTGFPVFSGTRQGRGFESRKVTSRANTPPPDTRPRGARGPCPNCTVQYSIYFWLLCPTTPTCCRPCNMLVYNGARPFLAYWYAILVQILSIS